MKKINLMAFAAMMCLGILSMQAQTSATRTAEQDPPKRMKLSPASQKTLAKWNTTKHMELLPSGNFVPLQHTAKGGAMPGGNTNSYASGGGINCAKIPCPPVFGPDVTCWECQ